MTEEIKRGPGCEGCKFLARADYGYSNYTVEGSDIRCLKKLNPALPLDDSVRSAAFNTALKFGETCEARVEGDGPWFDVDGDVTAKDFKDDPEIYALLLAEEEAPDVPPLSDTGDSK